MLDDILRHSLKNAATSGGQLAKTQYVKSALSKTGMRKNLKAFAYRQRELNPDITPKGITQKYDSEFGKGARTWQGEEQMYVSGGSTPTKQTDISLEGQRPLQLQDKSKNAARKTLNGKNRNEVGFTSNKERENYARLQGIVRNENNTTKAAGGNFKASIEHDIAIMGGKKWWSKVGPLANNNSNLFIARDHYAREYKNNFEYWFYNWQKKKGNNWVVKTDRSNMKDLEILEVSTGKILGVIPMPNNYTSGVPADLKADLLDMLKSNAEGFKP
ncbi:MAG: hypothetical protein CMC78_02470 [Flavobacteriaceae bacterium]|nr:hypothetical protein [Flavobacteriaceae bacterium]|tara:strand:- start:802 stop:1620 length:819 start_codon:yes stop_codon:yes gene_type:complete